MPHRGTTPNYPIFVSYKSNILSVPRPYQPASTATPSLLVEQIGDQPRPARLVRCPQPHAGIPVKILMEPDIVVEMRVGLQPVLPAMDRPRPLLVPQEQLDQPHRNFIRD